MVRYAERGAGGGDVFGDVETVLVVLSAFFILT